MSSQSVILITHPESGTEMIQKLHAQVTGDKSTAVQKTKTYLSGLANGSSSGQLKIGAGAAKASATVSVAATAAADDTVVVNGVTFTAKSEPSGANQFAIGSTADEAATNLAAKVADSALAMVSGYVTAAKTTDGVKEVTSITCVADSSGSLDGKYFVLSDKAGTVGFWIDVGNGGGSAPTGAAECNRAVEITTVTTGMTAAQVAGVIATAINADAEFVAPAATGAVVTVTDAYFGARANGAAGDSGFTVAKVTDGVNPVVTVTSVLPGILGNAQTLAGTGGFTASAARLSGGTAGTEKTYSFGGGV